MVCPNCHRSVGKSDACNGCGWEKSDPEVRPEPQKSLPRPRTYVRPAGEPYLDPDNAERARRVLEACRRGPAALLELGQEFAEEEIQNGSAGLIGSKNIVWASKERSAI